MPVNTYSIIIILSCVVIISYLFSLVSRKTNIPSVLLLMAVGIGLKYFTGHLWYNDIIVNKLVKILGAIGLIMIVLEAALDLKAERSKLKLIGNSFGAALFIFAISATGIGFIINQWLQVSFENAFIYAVPLSIISSAIVIPSTENLPEEKREFIIYESSLSDIIGIMVFNYMLMENALSLSSTMVFSGKLLLAIVISVAASLLLIYIVTRATSQVKFFMLFAVLALIYALGEQIHLPSLLIVLVFGLVFNNSKAIMRGPLKKLVPADYKDGILELMKSITAETSFLVRTFFFIIFGYSVDLKVVATPEVWELGSVIIVALFIVRYLYLRIILKANLFPELFLMPRGLVTILLFYSIPAEKSIGSFNAGVLFFVVAVTSIIMMVGLLFYGKEKNIDLDS